MERKFMKLALICHLPLAVFGAGLAKAGEF
jgi:hypothetical protein